MVVHTCHLSYTESVNERIATQASVSTKTNPVLKITKAKRAGGMFQVIEISSNIRTAKIV
jgi:hypothetical protein